MKNTNSSLAKQITLTIICLLLGFAITLQFKSVRFNKGHSTNLRAQELQAQLNNEQEKNASLQEDLEEAKKQITELRSGAVSEAVTGQLLNAERLAGLIPLTGPGVTVTLSDSKGSSSSINSENLIIHDSDIRTVINELLGSGAEAISINGERIVSTSSIRCVGPTVIINNTRLSTPFIITAIGDSKTLEAGLIVKGGVVDSLTPWGINITIAASEKLTVPAFTGSTTFKYAKIAEDEKSKTEEKVRGDN
ncbi:MAG: DUF881 domain-containing protein [Clostridia bacterium]|nr:DUF881 domain-containing protein [Clostridia bacterium]